MSSREEDEILKRLNRLDSRDRQSLIVLSLSKIEEQLTKISELLTRMESAANVYQSDGRAHADDA